jgi:uncharacterized protein YkwD
MLTCWMPLTATLVVALSFAQNSEPKAKPSEHDWLVKHEVIQELLQYHNEHRAQSGYSQLRLNAQMCLAAQEHAEWMAETGYYQHSNLPWQEIIFAGPQSARDAVNGWIWSPSHHGIMLSGTEVGFGYAVRNGSTYWVGVFQ